MQQQQQQQQQQQEEEEEEEEDGGEVDARPWTAALSGAVSSERLQTAVHLAVVGARLADRTREVAAGAAAHGGSTGHDDAQARQREGRVAETPQVRAAQLRAQLNDVRCGREGTEQGNSSSSSSSRNAQAPQEGQHVHSPVAGVATAWGDAEGAAPARRALAARSGRRHDISCEGRSGGNFIFCGNDRQPQQQQQQQQQQWQPEPERLSRDLTVFHQVR